MLEISEKGDANHQLFKTLTELAEAQGLKPQDYTQCQSEEVFRILMKGRVRRIVSGESPYIVIILKRQPLSVPGTSAQHLILVSESGKIHDQLSCRINSRYGRVQTEVPKKRQDDSSLLIIRFVPKGRWHNWHTLSHGGKSHTFHENEANQPTIWDKNGLCRIGIQRNKFKVIFPYLKEEHGKQAAKGIDSILADMATQGSKFRADKLHAMGVAGLSAVFDRLFPETASPKDAGALEDSISQLVEQLGDDDFQTRNSAMAKLIELGDVAKTSVFAATRSSDAEVANRAKRVLRAWASEAKRYEDLASFSAAFVVYLNGVNDADRLEELARRTRRALERGMPKNARYQILRHCLRPLARSGNDKFSNVLKPLLKHQDVQVAVLVTRTILVLSLAVQAAAEFGIHAESPCL